MRTLDSGLLTELGLTITRPGYLVQLGYSYTLRLSTIGDVLYNSVDWVGADVKVSSVTQSSSGSSSATLTLGNTDGAYGAIVLREGASDIPVSIYACYAGATDAPVLVFSGATDGAEVSLETVTLSLVDQRNRTLYCPREFISPPVFNFLQPEGTKITFNGETFVLQRSTSL